MPGHFKRVSSSSLLMLPSDFWSAVAAAGGAGGSTSIFLASSPYLQEKKAKKKERIKNELKHKKHNIGCDIIARWRFLQHVLYRVRGSGA
jgi:hypothetical protein